MAAPPICPACEAAGSRHFITHRGMELLECPSCRLVFMAEMPSGEDLGGIYIEPDDSGLAAVHAKAASKMRRPRDLTSWDGFKPPSHCVYFNPPALVRFLERHGFRILRRRLAFKPGIKLIAARG